MNKLLYLALFAAGAATGVAATWQYFKTKYEKIADEEIASVKEIFVKLDENAKAEREEEIVKDMITSGDVKQYERVLKQVNYSNITENKGVKPVDDGPFVIEPGEFDENGYETSTLFFYADGQLADDNDELIEDVDGTVGLESLNHFGEYEDDSVFVRNDRLKTDFEILRDERNYSDLAIKKRPQDLDD